MQSPLESSILQTAIAALDASALLRLQSNLNEHMVRLKAPTPKVELNTVEIITSPKYREQLISHIANGGNCQNFHETILQQ